VAAERQQLVHCASSEQARPASRNVKGKKEKGKERGRDNTQISTKIGGSQIKEMHEPSS
jgi:hypothetical protein